MSSNQKSWKLDSFEVAKSVGTNTGSKFKVYISKIMPLITFGKAKTKIIPLNKNCLVNDIKCKPSVAARVTTANYIVVPISNSTKFWKGISHGTKLNVNVSNGSVDQLLITGQK